MQLSLLTLALTKIYPRGKFSGSALDLDFTSGNNTLDSRITFSRASNATLTDSTGKIAYAPHNLLTYSEQFDNAAWTKSQATTTANTTVSPDGSITADRFVPQSGLSSPSAATSFTAVVGTTYFVSVYAKQDASNKFLMVQLDGDLWNSVTSAERPRVWFDPTTGQIAATQRILTSGVQSIGNGWYRVWLSVFCSTGGATAVRIGMQSASGSIAGYTGDGISGIYLWGAQLNVGALQPYYSTTVKNLLGYTQEFDNAAWTKSNSFIQTNQIRNNTMQGAVAGSPGTLPTNWLYEGSGLGTLSQQVVAVGVSSGISYMDLRLFGTASAGDVPIAFESRSAAAAASGQTWTISSYLAIVGGGTTNITSINLRQTGRSSVGAAIENITGSNLKGQLSSSLSRFSSSGTFASASTAYDQPNLDIVFTAGPVDITLRIGMPQLVQGATAGDVVATYGTAKAVMYQAPDGTMSADKLVESAANTTHFVSQPAFVPNGTPLYGSFYVKTAERTSVRIRATTSTDSFIADFDLATETVLGTSVVGGGSILGSSITSIGNGWFRVAVSGKFTSGTAPQLDLWLRSTASTSYPSYTGDGTSGIYIWGAQLSDSASLDPYVYNPQAAPSASAYYGPRFDYDPITLQPKGWLIEEQRTNLLTYSEQFDNAAWTKTRTTITANSSVSPDGTISADKFIDDTTASSSHRLDSSAITVSSGYSTFSLYVKAAERSRLRLSFDGTISTVASSVSCDFNLSNGTAGAAAVSGNLSGATTSISLVNNGWYRLTVSASASASFNATLRINLLDDNGNVSYTGDGTSGIYIWGAQLEAGSFATSYIPTTSAQVTRASEIPAMIGTNFSSWYNQNEGTLFAEATPQASNTSACALFEVGDGTANNRIGLFKLSTSGNASMAVLVSNTTQVSTNNGAWTTTGKLSGAYKADDFAASFNGGTVATDTSGLVPVVTQATIGRRQDGGNILNGHLRRIAYWPRRLSNAELQGVTS